MDKYKRKPEQVQTRPSSRHIIWSEYKTLDITPEMLEKLIQGHQPRMLHHAPGTEDCVLQRHAALLQGFLPQGLFHILQLIAHRRHAAKKAEQ